MRNKRLHGSWKKALVLGLIGLGLALLIRSRNPGSVMVFAADLAFAEATVFLFFGIVHQLGNMHMFTSFTWGFKSFHKLMQGKQDSSGKMKEEYLAYRDSRPQHSDVSFCLLIGLAWLVLSVLLSLLA